MSAIDAYNEQVDKIYKVKPQRWYEAHPYAFQWVGRQYGGSPPSGIGAIGASIFANQNVEGRITFNLPITPKNISTHTHFATNVMTTLYGIVEEHSEVRYWDVTISGTTGITPEHFAPVEHNEDWAGSTAGSGAAFSKYRSDGRKTHNFPAEGGILDTLDDFGIGSGAIGAIGQISSDIDSLFSGQEALSKTGVLPEQSGYAAFHNFYRFLLLYKKDAAGLGKAGFKKTGYHPLLFINYKDNVKYDCVPIDFSLIRDASDPMVYNYVLKLKCFNMRQTTGGLSDGLFEKFFKQSVGLDGVGPLDAFGDALGGALNLVSTLASLF